MYRNYIDKDIKQVGYRFIDGKNYQDFYITKQDDGRYLIEYAENYQGDGIHSNLRITKEQLEEFIKNIQHQLLDDNWKPEKQINAYDEMLKRTEEENAKEAAKEVAFKNLISSNVINAESVSTEDVISMIWRFREEHDMDSCEETYLAIIGYIIDTIDILEACEDFPNRMNLINGLKQDLDNRTNGDSE